MKLLPACLKKLSTWIAAILSSPSLYLVNAQGGISPFRAGGTWEKSLGLFVDFFKNDYTILFIIFVGGWAFVYITYRIGLERSGRIPPQFCSKLAGILALITITPLLYTLQKYPNAKTAVRELMRGYIGIASTLVIGAIIYIIVYYTISHWTEGGTQPGAGP